jgi:predicted HD phosphohydrolase
MAFFLFPLTEACVETLNKQGCKIGKIEIETCVRNAFFKNSLMLRIWDYRAKIPNEHISELGYYFDLSQKH